jgi:hypothetical protein
MSNLKIKNMQNIQNTKKIIIFMAMMMLVAIFMLYFKIHKTELLVYQENINPSKNTTREMTPPKLTATSSPIIPVKTIPQVVLPKITPILAPETKPKATETPTDYGTAFLEDFSTNYSVVESDNLQDSTSPGWWLGSGAYFYSTDGISSTILGPLDAKDPWRKTYSTSNPEDTDDGYYPQNIFRLVLLRHKWLNFQQELSFKIINSNLSKSWNRNSSNGVFFFNRFQDENNLYYSGIRVDGAAVIKKKYKGVYYDLALKQFYKNETYDRETNPNLIPEQKWFGLRSEINTNSDNTVTIKLYIDKDGTGNWILAAQGKDDGESHGGKAILDEGYAGIRTDFMDVQFDNYKVTKVL